MKKGKLRPSDVLNNRIQELISNSTENSLKDFFKWAMEKILQEALVYGVLIRASNKGQRVVMSDLDLTILRHIRKTIVGESGDNEYLSYEVAAWSIFTQNLGLDRDALKHKTDSGTRVMHFQYLS